MGSRELIGRDQEISLLAGHVARGTDGPTAVLIEGEAGIGKTALWESCLETAKPHQEVLMSRPGPRETELAFAGLADILAEITPAEFEGLPQRQRKALLVALGLEGGSLTGSDDLPLAHAALSLLADLSTRRPVVIAVDDVQWLDLPSARVLEFVMRRLRAEPIALVATWRQTDSGDQVPLGLDRALPRDHLARLKLGPLSLGSLGHLVRRELGRALPRPIMTRVHQASAGNPFYALEIARTILSEGLTLDSGQPLPLPDELRELVGDRIRRLPEEVRTALAAVAVSSRPSVGLVTAALGAGSGHALGLAADDEVIDIVAGQIRFRHPLLASQAQGAVSVTRLREVHSRLAGVVGDLESRARHLALGANEPDENVAKTVALAAQSASRRGAGETAAELAELAIEATPIAERTAYVERVLTAAELQTRTGGLERAEVHFRTAIDMASTSEARARAFVGLAEIGTDFGERLSLGRRALEEAGESPGLASRAHVSLSTSLFLAGDMQGCAAEAKAAFESAGLGEHPVDETVALQTFIFSEASLGRPVSDDLAKRALELDSSSGLRDEYVSPSFWVGIQWMWKDRLDLARPLMEKSLRRVDEMGSDISRPGVLIHLVELDCREGYLDRAVERARMSVEEAELLGDEQSQGACLYALALAEACAGNVEVSREAGQRSLAISESLKDEMFSIQALWSLGFLELSCGYPDESLKYNVGLPDRLAKFGYREPAISRFHPDVIEAAVAVGDLDTAYHTLKHLEELAHETGRLWALGCVHRGKALLEAQAGEQSALEDCARAIEFHQPLGQPLELGRTLLVAGVVQRRFKRRAASKEALMQASSIFDQIGARLWRKRAEEELLRWGPRASRTTELTATERKIAELVAEGRTNKEVADALFVSQKTVEANLSRVYRKLGVRSRTELALALRDH